jgi:hypothetical protein
MQVVSWSDVVNCQAPAHVSSGLYSGWQFSCKEKRFLEKNYQDLGRKVGLVLSR